jgi:hypothetical protein
MSKDGHRPETFTRPLLREIQERRTAEQNEKWVSSKPSLGHSCWQLVRTNHYGPLHFDMVQNFVFGNSYFDLEGQRQLSSPLALWAWQKGRGGREEKKEKQDYWLL